jgi:hypothetical protein
MLDRYSGIGHTLCMGEFHKMKHYIGAFELLRAIEYVDSINADCSQGTIRCPDGMDLLLGHRTWFVVDDNRWHREVF